MQCYLAAKGEMWAKVGPHLLLVVALVLPLLFIVMLMLVGSLTLELMLAITIMLPL